MTTPTQPVGYIVNHPAGLQGSPGIGYEYVLAANGLFVQAENNAITARIRVADAEVRGLEPVQEKISLTHGPIPATLLQEGVQWMRLTPNRERYFAVRWDGVRYRLHAPRQEGQASTVRYEVIENAILEVHSHARHPAFFSATDDQDEQGLRVYGVVGHLHQPTPQLMLRLGVYGHFRPLEWQQVFDSIGFDIVPYTKTQEQPLPKCPDLI